MEHVELSLRKQQKQDKMQKYNYMHLIFWYLWAVESKNIKLSFCHKQISELFKFQRRRFCRKRAPLLQRDEGRWEEKLQENFEDFRISNEVMYI